MRKSTSTNKFDCDMDKENKKFKFANVNNVRPVTPSIDSDTVFNSTLKNSADLLPKDADLSCISSITSCSNYMDFNNEVMMIAANYKSNESNEIITNANEIQIKQAELDSLYMLLLTTSLMKENIKKCFRDEEENAMREMFEIHKANESLKKSCSELEFEEKFVDNLLELVKFMDIFNDWILKNSESLNEFKNNYKKLAEMCSKAKDYIELVNINFKSVNNFEESLNAELRNTCLIIDQINKSQGLKNAISAPDPQIDEKIDVKLLEELTRQYTKLKEKIVKYNGFNSV
ncbi:unnamed protein product [Brachionus calyciflorus]|uniref:Uncharacterized protein n=1 Tax=Brachionus calyciflorus TaxID=104777 RepID=A0A813VTG8_9BILA|nr:unnamed protein product [Brachionus calyciflorus]